MVGCGPKFSGILFFYSYFLLMALVMLNLFIAVIVEAYDEIKERESRTFNYDAIEYFNKYWQKYDADVSLLVC
jgi:Ion transport protein